MGIPQFLNLLKSYKEAKSAHFMNNNKLFIVGLANPGKKYENTRHNAGALVLDYWMNKLGIEYTESKKGLANYCQLATTSLTLQEGQEIQIFFMQPKSYMNLSGGAVRQLLNFYKAEPHELLVIHDETELPLGEIRLKTGGGHRGHNGLRDIIANIGPDFHRLRFGIGRPDAKEELANYVLAKFSKAEQASLAELHEKAKLLCLDFLETEQKIIKKNA